jgi:hypothetical protein
MAWNNPTRVSLAHFPFGKIPRFSISANRTLAKVKNDLVEILAEILVQDYQVHPTNTVGSPPRTNRNFSTDALCTGQTDLLDSA